MADFEFADHLIDRGVLRTVVKLEVTQVGGQRRRSNSQRVLVQMQILGKGGGSERDGVRGIRWPMAVGLENQRGTILPRPFAMDFRLHHHRIGRLLADFFQGCDRRAGKADAQRRRLEIFVGRTRCHCGGWLRAHHHLTRRVVGKRARFVRFPPAPRLPGSGTQRHQ